MQSVPITTKVVSSNETFIACTLTVSGTKFVKVMVMVFNATFNNISVISWRSVLLVEETRVVEEAGENHRPWASNW
jgi:hypothetical protein